MSFLPDARGRLQNAVTRLLEMIERTTQQLLEAKATQTDLLETMATRTQDNDELAARLHDLEEQVRQEVAAKEYLGLELHKAEGEFVIFLKMCTAATVSEWFGCSR